MTPMAIHKLQRHVYSSVTKEMTCSKKLQKEHPEYENSTDN